MNINSLEGGPLDGQLGVVADALSLAVVVMLTGPVLPEPQPAQEPPPAPPGLLGPPPGPGLGVAGAGAHRHRVPLGRGQVEALGAGLPPDDLLVHSDDVGPHLVQLVLALLFLLQRDRHELQHQEVDRGGHGGEAPQQEAEAGHHVARPECEAPVLLEGHEVPEADGGERDEAVVTRLEVRPALLGAVQHCPP